MFHNDLLLRSEEFYDAFRQLRPQSPTGISWPRYFLLCHAIELALKAFLALHGANSQELQTKFGHKIDPLMRCAVGSGLKIGPLAASEIMLLDEAHANHWPRYPHQEGKPVFVIDQFEPYVLELLKAVSAAIRGPGLLPPFVEEWCRLGTGYQSAKVPLGIRGANTYLVSRLLSIKYENGYAMKTKIEIKIGDIVVLKSVRR